MLTFESNFFENVFPFSWGSESQTRGTEPRDTEHASAASDEFWGVESRPSGCCNTGPGRRVPLLLSSCQPPLLPAPPAELTRCRAHSEALAPAPGGPPHARAACPCGGPRAVLAPSGFVQAAAPSL